MSNERIYEILAENNLEWMPQVYPNTYPRIIKAMEQYGKEQRNEGANETFNEFQEVVWKTRQLVQAQKEFIEWIGIKLPSLSHENKCKMADFLNQIKELEQ